MRTTIHRLKWLLAVLLPVFLLLGCTSSKNKKLLEKAVAEIRSEQRMELVSYKTRSVARSGENEDEKLFFVFGDRKMLVSFLSEITAGLDLKDFDPEKDLKYDIKEKHITVNLPDPVILSCDVPIDSIVVEHEKIGAFRAKFKPEEVVDVVMQGKETILKEILDNKRYPILSEAKENAQRTFTSLFRSAGFEKVDVVFPSDKSAKSSN